MPLVADITTPGNARVGLWRIEEDWDFFLNKLVLSPAETEILESLRTAKKRQWLASRYLLDRLLDHHERIETGTMSTGKPFLVGRTDEISLSHSDAYVAAMVGNTDLGVDIQRCKEKILLLEHKFANATESARIDRSNSLVHLHVLWGAKEALYKVYARKKLSFISNIFIDLPKVIYLEGGEFSGTIKLNNRIIGCVLFYHIFNNYVLVYAQKTYETVV